LNTGDAGSTMMGVVSFFVVVVGNENQKKWLPLQKEAKERASFFSI
jgi:hypothetical protein